jgi:hypothetical protein
VMSRHAPVLTAAIAVCFLTLCTAACPLPIAHTEALSAPVAGVLRRSDGTPIPGARVAVSTDYDDSVCAHAALETTTDSAGTFRLSGTEKRYRVMWVVPNLDRVAPGYRLCISLDEGLQTAYFGRGSLSAPAPLDSLTCLEWAWNDRTRVTCSAFARAEQTLASGGRWTEGEITGWYQLILTEAPTRVPGRRVPVQRPRAYVQWVERGPNDLRATVTRMVELPIDPKVTGLWEIELLQRYGRWHASLRGTKPKFMRDFASAQLMFELGAPGQIRSVEPW